MSTSFRLSKKYPPVPAFASPKAVTALDAENALKIYLAAFEGFEGRVTLVSGSQPTHLKFRWDGRLLVSTTTLRTRASDHLPKSALINALVDQGTHLTREELAEMKKAQILDLLDPRGTPEGIEAEEAIIRYLISTTTSTADEASFARLESKKLEARLRVLEARVSWLVGELVHIKSETFLASVPSAPSSLL